MCMNRGFISEEQGSSKKGSRTSDHLLIVRFLIDKYVKKKRAEALHLLCRSP